MPNLKIVYLDSDVYLACLDHALSNESEEVMGLLIGEITDGTCTISAYESLRRLDKRKDRVEISPEQLTEATEKAEAIAKELNRESIRIVGWYHSHPHITVFPSHVDLNTQLNYQQLDKGFVGMIISVFSEDKSTKEQEIVVSCFQTHQYVQPTARYIKLCVRPSSIKKPCLEAMIRLPHIILLEEEELFQKAYVRAKGSALALAQNQAEQTKAMSSIIQRVSVPLFIALRNKVAANRFKLTVIEDEIFKVREEIGELLQQVT